MTDEQIKQKAEEYADSMKYTNGEPEWVADRDAFIAGAHSRDKEIKELKEENLRIETLLGMYRRMTGEYELKLQELRNPWISAKDILPEDDVEVIGITKRGFAFLIKRISNEWCGTEYRELLCPEIAYWMPIPKLPKEK